MKANEFVKKFGWVKAKELTEKAIRVYGGIGDSLYVCDGGYLAVAHPSYLKGSEFLVLDLKRLVESHELVERLGGLDAARNIFMYAGDGVHACRRVSQSIADMESCQ